MAVFAWIRISPQPIQAQVAKPDFLYKFLTNWADVATDGTDLYMVNSSYSRIEKYTVTGSYLTSNWGGYGIGDGQLNQPRGIDFVTGSIYVADTGNNRINEYDSAGGFVASFGSYGSAVGQFDHPQDIAVDATETYMVVADTGNNRIQVVTLASGAIATYSGTLGTGINQFSSPKGVAIWGSAPNFTVLVADTGNNRIVAYTLNTNSTPVLNYDANFGRYGTTNDAYIRFNQPTKITVDGSQNFYVIDTTNRIQKFNNGRSWQSTWNTHDLHGTSGLAVISNTLYVAVPYNQIDSYNSQFGTYSSSFTYELQQPVDVALDTLNNIYLNNATTNMVSKFNSSWAPVAEWNNNGSAFNGALGIGVNTGGEVCVANTGNNSIERFSTNGVLITGLPVPSITPYSFNSPKDVAMEGTGKMYIADSDNNRILKYKSDNTYDWGIGWPTPTWSSIPGFMTPTPVAPTGPFFLRPYGITVDTYNTIFVADSGYNRIQSFDANGNWKNSWGMYGSADNYKVGEVYIPQFDNPQGIAIQNTSSPDLYYLYVADTGNNRIQRFDQTGAKDPIDDVWGQYGSLDGQFNQPRSVAVDTQDRIYVSEVNNKRVQVFGNAVLNAGLSVVETNGTAVTEDGSVIDSYTIKLNTQPSANVSVAITSSDSAQLEVSSSTLLFTPYNWNVPQIVTVLPKHDEIDRQTTQIITLAHTTTSSDANYNSGSTVVISVPVTYTDTDTAGVTRSTNSTTANEDGTGLQTYTFVLDSKPTASVVININSDDNQLLSNGVNPLSLTFTTSNWNIPQPVIVSAVHDWIANGNRTAYIDNEITTTDTSGYQSVTIPQLEVTITDATDIAGVTLSTDTITLTEGSTAGTYTVVLNSKPTANVTLTPTFSATELSISPSVLTFTDTDYNVLQTITVSALNDNIKNVTSPRDVTITYASTSTDLSYDGASTPFVGGGGASNNVVTAAVTDSNEAGVILTHSGSGYVIEGLTEAEYSVALNSIPTSTIILAAESSVLNATTGAYLYTFTPSNWNIPQYATISATNNSLYSGTQSATITHKVVSTSDPNYALGSSHILNFTLYDTDWPGITISQPNGVVNLTEYGVTDTYSVKLNTQPSANVTVTIDGAAQATASPHILTFTPSNWSTNQTVTLTAINDYLIEGAHTAPIAHTTSSSDTGYNNLTTYLTVNIADDDNTVPGIQITQTGDKTEVTEGGPGDTYTLVLTSKPTSHVRIRVLGNNWEASTSAGLFTFLPTNWNVPQTVYVVAKDDPQIDGQKITIFQHIVTSSDLHYNGMDVETVTIYVNDNDGISSSSGPVAAPVCSKTPPDNTPRLFQIDAGANSATLYFTPIRDNISYYYIAYGLKPGDIRYGVSFDMGSYDGVIDYTIYMLNASTKYYFKVRGGNGCAPGPWGNETYAVTSASGSASIRSYYAPASSYATTGSSGSSGGSSGGASHPTFTRDLYPGSRGADVRSLQIYLNQSGYTVAQGGPGSPGNETDLYGPLTASAIRRYQEANYQSILSPLGYSSGTGIFGPSTRNYVNSH